MKKKIALMVTLAVAAVCGISAAGNYIQNVRTFDSGRSANLDVVRYYDGETDTYIYVSDGGLQVVKGRSW